MNRNLDDFVIKRESTTKKRKAEPIENENLNISVPNKLVKFLRISNVTFLKILFVSKKLTKKSSISCKTKL